LSQSVATATRAKRKPRHSEARNSLTRSRLAHFNLAPHPHLTARVSTGRALTGRTRSTPFVRILLPLSVD
jgi:hypothetical protein